ncbi:MAG: cysteine--tRNA ligase [Candidatus Magasanikbacteria bacterium RIFCSPHIGHO2_01_FULL_41_23]|uniref:Cysteine--tRNA ligase n=1 Tax=Candidatus Magasanikbacteria bacterium RIFCSPLOWO2_01_FULL_40_15 TaxID=1798686 RepID=A0A1F6N3S8_9BACT|nr:MAG: cysteine--tRNA ligase [Candidatus Magasanikbacteria bacterium RIFCSPHIGHO2_01_FULL_41_23]OGH76589.1 MAG: cysteine--tRNA ligase [Candidatus Magasanikbacteria bacterium RIFCSPHIGHO2_12_FULL_41_16]OGH78567.1 MAG: cysteine--tRNA ligase [Candidatus Magasanikbacteria bacterium RIFCSPLOWO2_01_FULL_40_15]
MLKFYNTLTKSLEKFKPHGEIVGLYTCGPTVYNYAHIGNLRTYIFADILRRVLEYNNFKVNHVMNITDVGHLTDDADQGEDKMEKGAKREGKTAWEVAEFYTNAFLNDTKKLNILPATIICKATDHIPEQISQVQILIDKGLTYETNDGIYFDTTKIADYGKLARLNKQTLKTGARVAMGEKKNPHDFALWKFSPKNEKRQMEWSAFGRNGFPGWHIECSAMSIKFLGEQFDIHCGGIDHIPVHHTNEIAQAEAVTNKKPWVNYWLHGEHLVMDDKSHSAKAQVKMAKSGDNFITVQTLIDHGINPLAYRYFLLQTHYRKQLQFSWEALEAAQTGLNNLKKEIQKLPTASDIDTDIATATEEEFLQAINNDLNVPEALAVLWSQVKTKNISQKTVAKWDRILALNLLYNSEKKILTIPPEIQKLLDERALARADKNWAKSDALRDKILILGFVIKDTDQGQKISAS